MGYLRTRLSEDEVEYLARSMEGPASPYGDKEIRVEMKKAYLVDKAKRILESTLGGTASTSLWSAKVIYLKFPTRTECNEARAELNSAIVQWTNNWANEHHEEYVESGLAALEEPEVSDPTTTPTTPDPNSPTQNNVADWTTYIIIGAAAVVIIMLLWDSRK